jgi:hypothetical protein
MRVRWLDMPIRNAVQETARHYTKWTALPKDWMVTCCGCGLTHVYQMRWRKHKGTTILMKRCRIHQGVTKVERKRLAKKRKIVRSVR